MAGFDLSTEAGIRVAVPVESLEVRLAGLPEGVTVEPGRIEVRFTEAQGGRGASLRAGAGDDERLRALRERGEAEMNEALVPIVDRREIARPGAAAVVAPEVTGARRASASRPDPGAIRDRRGSDYACTDRHRNRRRRADNRCALQRGARRPGHLVPGRVHHWTLHRAGQLLQLVERTRRRPHAGCRTARRNARTRASLFQSVDRWGAVEQSAPLGVGPWSAAGLPATTYHGVPLSNGGTLRACSVMRRRLTGWADDR